MIEVESLIRTQLERLAPLPDTSRQDWADVLERCSDRRMRRKRSVRVVALLATVALLAVALFVVAPALGFRPVAEVFGEEPIPTWIWPEGVPGDPVAVPKIVRSANEDLRGKGRYEPIDFSTVRQVVVAGKGSAGSAFLAARGLNGDVCLGKLGGGNGGTTFAPFECLIRLRGPGPRAQTSKQSS